MTWSFSSHEGDVAVMIDCSENNPQDILSPLSELQRPRSSHQETVDGVKGHVDEQSDSTKPCRGPGRKNEIKPDREKRVKGVSADTAAIRIENRTRIEMIEIDEHR